VLSIETHPTTPAITTKKKRKIRAVQTVSLTPGLAVLHGLREVTVTSTLLSESGVLKAVVRDCLILGLELSPTF